MQLDLHNSVAIVTQASDAEIAWLKGDEQTRGFLDFRFPARGAFGVESETKRCVFQQTKDGRWFMPSGVVPMVKREARCTGHDVEVRDVRVRPCEPDDSADLSWLRNYQREAVEAVVSRTRGIIKIATSGGKGEVLVGLGKRLPCLWLMCAYSYDLVRDAAERWDKRGDGTRAGRIGGGHLDLGDERFICATWQTLLSRIRAGDRRVLELLARVQGFIGEECHTTPTTTASAVMQHLDNAYWRVGVSGTPLDRADQKSILAICLLGPVIYTVTAPELVEMGVSAACTVRMVPCTQWRSMRMTWPAIYKELVVRSEERNAAVLRAVRLAERPTLLFFRETAHGRRLMKMIQREGIACDISYGVDKGDMRRAKLRWLAREGDAVLLANKIFQLGEVDASIVEVRSIVNASGGASAIEVLQQLGRGMRRFDAQGREVKSTFTLYDIDDHVTGYADPDYAPALVQHARERVAAYQKEGHVVEYLDEEEGS